MSQEVIKSDYETMIFTFRGRKVMVDTDLALLYEVTTKRLKEQVKRNISRFPEDFLFELNGIEKAELVANCDRLNSLKHSSRRTLRVTRNAKWLLDLSHYSVDEIIGMNHKAYRSIL